MIHDAHKALLASFSQFFKNILTKNPNQHPLIYVKLENLKVILDSIYSGKVTTDQNSLNIAGQRENKDVLFDEKAIMRELVGIETEPNIKISESNEDAGQEKSKKRTYHPCDQCEYTATNLRAVYRHKSATHKNH